MSIVKVQKASRIALPEDVREALGVKEGDYLETELVEGGVMFKPVHVTNRDAAREDLLSMLRGSRYTGADPEPSDDELMEMVVEEIKTDRRERREGRS
jgi:AbrB family looped-hinge helix DNA binding protein